MRLGSIFEPFFLEVYLDEPLDVVLSRFAGHGVERGSLAEMGNLASAQPRYGELPETIERAAAGFAKLRFTSGTTGSPKGVALDADAGRRREAREKLDLVLAQLGPNIQ